MYIPHFLYPFICWWIFRFLFVFQLFWIMLQWTWELRYFSKIVISVLLHVPRNGSSGSYDSLFSIFWGTTVLFSIANIPFFSPTVHKGFNFYTFLPTFIIFCFFLDNNPNRCEVISNCDFNLQFSNSDLRFFLHMCWPSVWSSLKKFMSIQVFLLVF